MKDLLNRNALLDLREPSLEEEAIAAGIGSLAEGLLCSQSVPRC